MTIRMNVQQDDFGLIRVQFHEPGGSYRSAVWLTPRDAAVLVELLAPILRAEAAKMPVPLPPPIEDALNLDNWTEQTGYGSTEGAKCPHCSLIVKPDELPRHPGEMYCPACRRPFKWTVIHLAGVHAYNTLTLRPDQAAGGPDVPAIT
jgi:hypothetical protein